MAEDENEYEVALAQTPAWRTSKQDFAAIAFRTLGNLMGGLSAGCHMAATEFLAQAQYDRIQMHKIEAEIAQEKQRIVAEQQLERIFEGKDGVIRE